MCHHVSTTATYYIKTAADVVRNAMAKLENHIAESARTHSDEVEVIAQAMSSEASTIQ